MTNKPVPREPDRPEEVIGSVGFEIAKNAAFPPLWFYPYEDVGTRFKKSWWWYLALLMVDIGLFWGQLLAGKFVYLLLFPVAHIVILAVLTGAIGTARIPAWPTMLTAPAWLPEVRTMLLLGSIPFAAGMVQLARSTYDIEDGEMGLPMSEIRQRSDNAGKLPTLDSEICSLLIGETGAGKSSALKLLAYQFDYVPDEPEDDPIATIAHDLKRDFWDFYRENTDLQVERLSIEDSTVTWNLFLDAEQERQFNEIAKGVMGKKESGNPFHKGATQVLADAMIFLYRKGQDGDGMPDHADLLQFLEQDYETLYEVLSAEGFASASSINPDTGGAQETYSTMMENIRDVFVGDFAASGDFSLREYIENPNGRAIMIDTKIDEIETTGPMFRLILDLSIKYGMTSDTDVNYILDEIDQLPHLTRLSSLASAGRGVGVRGLIGIQTIGQIKAVYGKAVAGTIGNCPQGVYFSPGERTTSDYILDELGEQRETVTSSTESKSGEGLDAHHSSSRTEREVERAPITSAELKQFRAGDCVVKTRTEWWIGRVELLDDVDDDLDAAGVGIGAQFDHVDEDLPAKKQI